MSRLEELKRLISETAGRLEPIAAKLDVPYPYWISGADEGQEWCLSCAKSKMAGLQRKHPTREYSLSGGYGPVSKDGCCHCTKCGCLLLYSLTKTGVAEETDHFARHAQGLPSAEDAYHVLRILTATEYLDDLALLEAVHVVGTNVATALDTHQTETSTAEQPQTVAS